MYLEIEEGSVLGKEIDEIIKHATLRESYYSGFLPLPRIRSKSVCVQIYSGICSIEISIVKGNSVKTLGTNEKIDKQLPYCTPLKNGTLYERLVETIQRAYEELKGE